jgi:DNA-binding NarL/FixJ family response regulator
MTRNCGNCEHSLFFHEHGQCMRKGCDCVQFTSSLTEREREILVGLARGLTLKECAAELNIATKTAEAHRYNLYQKAGAHSIAAMIGIALRKGWLKLEQLPGEEYAANN